ncbi:IclR family transcriptional regulator [Sinomicrobium weinanense]|uniref:IclR family transcriptional regulator n=1 Tax=Sinomicrobium weinanense TaxID=2842200 RepID=A0A926Q1K0_9FLAO|nr:IclR family transcriptional regulator [Sinomicrobium weinanense]MBC9795817.1 IclR family transcriptional regulator [Sinomicrobium weinanense]MBU3121861.1 IclR family transcriptional regulator [Sinomicrobium weinanense]
MIQSVKRTFDILEYIAANGNLVRLNDIAAAVNLRNTTVHNFLNTLKELGYVEQDELSPRYRITPKISHLYLPEKSLYQLKKELKPVLEKLSNETGETTYLAIQLGSYYRHELKCEPSRCVRISLELGREEKMKHTAIGKVFMAYSPHLSAVMWQEMDRQEIKKLQKELNTILSNGYALDLEEFEEDLNCVAVPYLSKGRILAVICVAGPAFRFSKEKMIQTAEKINGFFVGGSGVG